MTITEYWPAPEAWFVGRRSKRPGLPGLHRIDWLYSAIGVSMEGEGIGLDGRMYHIDSLGNGRLGHRAAASATSPADGWARRPAVLARRRLLAQPGAWGDIPAAAGGWSAGPGRHVRAPARRDVRSGPSLPLHYYQSIAVDPSVIPLGSRVYVPAYRHDGYGGWFIAQDTGGAINGHHIDVYRSPAGQLRATPAST